MNRKFFDSLFSYGIKGAFGLPGAGKTTLSAALAAENERRRQKCLKQKTESKQKRMRQKWPFFDRVYSTDETIQNTYYVSYDELGKWFIKDNSLFLFEEAGLGVDCRAYKTLPKELKTMFALIRHHKSTIFWTSQTADVDKQLRVRSSELFLLTRSIGNFSLIKPITYCFGVDNDSGELRDIYHVPEGFEAIKSFLTRETFFFGRKRYYKFFDSYADTIKYKGKDPADSLSG